VECTKASGHKAHDREHQAVPSDFALRVKALESLLVEKGLVDPAALDAMIDTYEHKVGPRNGARVIGRAWVDPAYKKRLLADATNAVAEFGYGGQSKIFWTGARSRYRRRSSDACCLGQQPADVECSRVHGKSAIFGARPQLSRPIPVQFHAVTVGVT
jgi:hypothetical protein